jgi:hypothetical protein
MQEFDVFARYLSYQRLNSYKFKTIDPIVLYKWNLALSEVFYPLLNTIEIALRNRLHIGISEIVGDDHWLINRNQKIISMLHNHWCVKIESNIKDLAINNKLDEGHLIAELSFGFWTIFLNRQFEHKQFLWPNLKKQIFPFAHGVKINVIRDQFNAIRRLRNRIFHYEAIWHWQDLQQQHDAIIRAIEWLNPVLLKLVSKDRFKEIYSNRPIELNQVIMSASSEVVEIE